MKRRPGVERRRRRLADLWKGAKKGSLKDYSTSTLKKKYRQLTAANEVDSILSGIKHELESRGFNLDTTSGVETEFHTTMGHLFEFYTYQAIKKFSLMNIDPETFNISSFSYNGEVIENTGGQADTAYKKVEEWSKHNNTALRYRNQIIEAAEGVCKNLIFDWMKELNQNIEVSLIADEGGKGNPIGDMLLKIGGKTVVLELKWQTGAHQYTNIKWFSGVADKRLFGNNTFNKFLQNNQGIYWNYQRQKDDFMTQLTQTALLVHIFNTGGGTADSVTNYLIKKGNIAQEMAKLSQDGNVEKITMRLSKTNAQVDIQNMDVTKITKDKDQEGLKFSLKTGNKKIQIMAQAGISPPYHAASFWVSGMGALAEDNKAGTRQGPENYNFSFSMFLTQKLFFDLQNETSYGVSNITL